MLIWLAARSQGSLSLGFTVSSHPITFSLALLRLLVGRFHLAATRGHLDCLSLILGHGADVTATDATGESRSLQPGRCSQTFAIMIITCCFLITAFVAFR